MKFTDRLNNLGTETAFSVSQDAQEFQKSGKKVYPYHLGDLDIPTPSNIIDSTYRAMKDGKTGYNPPAGLPELRKIIAETVGAERGIDYSLHNVVIQPGGKPVISKFIQALMNPGDGVLYPNPGYPIYESQIKYFKGKAIPYNYISKDISFEIDRDRLEKSIDESTKLLIYNNYQNPIGAESDLDEMEWIANIAKKYNLIVLSDEAYFNIRYEGTSKSIASLPKMKERTVILYTFSKTFAMTGWRLGAAIGPIHLMKIFTKLAINDESCTNHFIQYGGIEALEGKKDGANKILKELKIRRNLLATHLESIPSIKVFRPNTTFYLFPDVTEIYMMLKCKTYEEFRLKILNKTGVSFCTREHFGTPLPDETKKYVRFAYSGISVKEINESMIKLKKFLLPLENLVLSE